MSNRTTKIISADGLSEEKGNKAIVHNGDLQSRMIGDIKDMEMDTFLALVEFMYPVKAIDLDGENIEITVDESKGLTTLNEIF
jgi:hypothetical protein